MDKVKVAIVGIGNMGSAHATSISNGLIENMELTAICDIDEDKIKWAKEHLCDGIEYYTDYSEMLASDAFNAVIIATPHYEHPQMAIDAFNKGLHVVCEKPAGVYTKQVREMNEVAAKSGRVFSLMYNQRTNPLYAKLREMVQSGELGVPKRLVWIITNWYRTQSYYNSSSWRATWSGEGGGVLINQCPHNLDLWQWIFGMPKKVSGFVSIGKYHDIEVEDDVTAYAEYENGATAVFITTTGETPGTNRLEISGDKGKVVIENGKMIFHKLSVSEREFCYTCEKGFDTPETEIIEIETNEPETAHNGILQNFTNAVLNGEKLIAPGEEGIRGLTISNAIHLSGWTGEQVTLPIDEDLYYEKLQEKVKTSKVKEYKKSEISDLQGTYNKRWEVR